MQVDQICLDMAFPRDIGPAYLAGASPDAAALLDAFPELAALRDCVFLVKARAR